MGEERIPLPALSSRKTAKKGGGSYSFQSAGFWTSSCCLTARKVSWTGGTQTQLDKKYNVLTLTTLRARISTNASTKGSCLRAAQRKMASQWGYQEAGLDGILIWSVQASLKEHIHKERTKYSSEIFTYSPLYSIIRIFRPKWKDIFVQIHHRLQGMPL